MYGEHVLINISMYVSGCDAKNRQDLFYHFGCLSKMGKRDLSGNLQIRLPYKAYCSKVCGRKTEYLNF